MSKVYCCKDSFLVHSVMHRIFASALRLKYKLDLVQNYEAYSSQSHSKAQDISGEDVVDGGDDDDIVVFLLHLSGVVEQHLEEEMVADDRDVISFVFPTWRKIYHLTHDQAALVLAV